MKTFWNTHRKEILAVLGVFLVFIVLRVPGVSLPYHQDEYKSVYFTEQGSESAGNLFAHPPLTQLIFRLAHFVFSSLDLRFFPIFFSSLSFFLIYFLLKKKIKMKGALVGVGLFTVCFYSVFASLMLDIDGAVLPFFFLGSIYTYSSLRETIENKEKKKSYIWGGVLLMALILGFLVKLSFILVVGTIIIDFIWDRYQFISKKQIIVWSISLVYFFVFLALTILIIRTLYPAFRIDLMFKHVSDFLHIEGRDYIQIVVQGIKAIFYISPLLVTLVFFTNKEVFEKARIYFIYLSLGFLFYFVIFDFSRGALDKYLMFIIVPAVMISSFVLDRFSILDSFYNFKTFVKDNLRPLLIGVIMGGVLICVNFLPHAILPLYPKTAWFSEVLHLHWLFLNPFMGGSGPLGFYVSFLLIVLGFIISVVLILFYFIKKEWRRGYLIILLIFGMIYNLVFIEELLFGKINGSSTEVLKESVIFVKNSPIIKNVITYNDSGAYELMIMGKYAGRFYTSPLFEEEHRQRFEEHVIKNGGYFLVINIPQINGDSFYIKFFSKCDKVYSVESGRISGNVYKCSK